MYLVTPYCLKTQNSSPSIVVNASSKELASKIAESQSELGKFKNWIFSKDVKKIQSLSLSGKAK